MCAVKGRWALSVPIITTNIRQLVQFTRRKPSQEDLQRSALFLAEQIPARVVRVCSLQSLFISYDTVSQELAARHAVFSAPGMPAICIHAGLAQTAWRMRRSGQHRLCGPRRTRSGTPENVPGPPLASGEGLYRASRIILRTGTRIPRAQPCTHRWPPFPARSPTSSSPSRQCVAILFNSHQLSLPGGGSKTPLPLQETFYGRKEGCKSAQVAYVR
jgi:hypothetical protein